MSGGLLVGGAGATLAVWHAAAMSSALPFWHRGAETASDSIAAAGELSNLRGSALILRVE